MTLTILNASILTTYGTYQFTAVSTAEAKKLVQENQWQSAIGHSSTAEILSAILEIDLKANRIEYLQKPGETALIFKLRSRPPEGKILTVAEIEEVGYEFGLLRRLN